MGSGADGSRGLEGKGRRPGRVAYPVIAATVAVSVAVGAWVYYTARPKPADVLGGIASVAVIDDGGDTAAWVCRDVGPLALGIVDGTIHPDDFTRILRAVSLDMADGVLTTDEIRDILIEARRIRDTHP
jgi:hypothetical protein